MLTIEGPWFKDEEGRTVVLRGVNLGGSSKVPYTPNGATYIQEGFYDHRKVSFVGRPFPLEEAGEHFERLREWGLTFLRFLVTWEAVEHAGPGIYDQEYLDYLQAVVQKAGEYGLALFIDPHQDVWSRFSGGDGAPGWTFEAVGLDMQNFGPTGAAIVHQTHGDPFPRMIWPSNSGKLAAATLFTLFFGGNDFASKFRVEGEPVQEYLQRHYIAAMQQVAQRLKDMPHVVGYDTMNEPLTGYIGWQNLERPGGMVKIGASPNPLQGMALASGIPQDVEVWNLSPAGARMRGLKRMNDQRISAWVPGCECIWRQHGVWELDGQGQPRLLRPDYFTHVDGRPVDFNNDYFRPFANRYSAAIRSIAPQALIFIETEPQHELPEWGPGDSEHIVSAPHWYDGFVLFMKQYSPFLGVDMPSAKLIFGRRRIRSSFAAQIGRLKQAAQEHLMNAPTLIGEFGIAFDLNKKAAYRTGDFRPHIQALDRSFKAMEDNLMNYTLWNYTSDNTNARGDQWNDEDLSIFSRDQQGDPKDINSGGRALEALLRPHPIKTAGEPLRISFNLKKKVFEFEFKHDLQVKALTEIYVPRYQYPDGVTVEVSDGSWELQPEEQRLVYRHSSEKELHTIRLKPVQ